MLERLTPPDPQLSDGVVAVRPFRAEDAPAVTVACQDPETQRWIPLIPVPYTEADARRYILMTLQAWHDGTSAEFAIVDPSGDRLLGSVGLHLGPNPRRHAIGYWIVAQERGHGYAERAVRLVTRWGFETLGIQRLALWTLPGNVSSQVVAERAGFRYEALARNWEEDRDDRPVDAVMYAMTPEDLADSIAAAAESRAESRAEAAAGAAPPGATVPELADVPRQLWASGTRAAPFVELVAVADLAPGTMRRVTLADLDLLVAWTDDGILVTDDRCPHMAAPLSIGELAGCVVSCPLHEGRFDLHSGDTVQMPTTGGLDADGEYHKPWSQSGAQPRPEPLRPEPLRPEPPTKKIEARRLTRVNRLRYYPARIRDGRLEAQIPIVPE
jgi:RimJ/RimL family protein N-acetyltransferase/nitrite reductase/ring-hydroxylating ferredoxin subunit